METDEIIIHKEMREATCRRQVNADRNDYSYVIGFVAIAELV
jgi:hypothetical protein